MVKRLKNKYINSTRNAIPQKHTVYSTVLQAFKIKISKPIFLEEYSFIQFQRADSIPKIQTTFQIKSDPFEDSKAKHKVSEHSGAF